MHLPSHRGVVLGALAATALAVGGVPVGQAAIDRAAAPAAVTQSTVRIGETTFAPSEGPINRQARAYCKKREHAVSGGAQVVGLDGDRTGEYYTFLVQSAPIGSDGEPVGPGATATGWLVEATNTANAATGTTGHNANLVAYVVCQKP